MYVHKLLTVFTPLFAANLPCWELLRDFGPSLMRHGDPSAVTELYTKHKNVFKTLAMAIDSLLNKYGKARFLSDDSAATACTVDDRLDMVTMDSHHLGMVKHMGDSLQRKTTEDSVWNAVPYRIDTVYMCDYNDDRRNLLSILNLYYMLLLGHLSVCGMGQRSEH